MGNSDQTEFERAYEWYKKAQAAYKKYYDFNQMIRDFQLMKNHLNVLAPENIMKDLILRDDKATEKKFLLEEDEDKKIR